MSTQIRNSAGGIMAATGIFILLLTAGCQKEETAPQAKNASPEIDTVRVLHLNRELVIPVKGYLKPWQEINISLGDSATIISLLVENGAQVSRGDLLASLWPIPRNNEYTPIDLHAPISGTIKNLQYGISESVAPNKSLMQVANYDRLIMEVNVHPMRLPYIQKEQKAILRINETEHKGHVQAIDQTRAQIVMMVPNTDNRLPHDAFVSAEVHCGTMSGDFIPREYLDNRDTLRVKVDQDIDITLFRIGYSDSLAMVYPPLARHTTIQIR